MDSIYRRGSWQTLLCLCVVERERERERERESNYHTCVSFTRSRRTRHTLDNPIPKQSLRLMFNFIVNLYYCILLLILACQCCSKIDVVRAQSCYSDGFDCADPTQNYCGGCEGSYYCGCGGKRKVAKCVCLEPYDEAKNLLGIYLALTGFGLLFGCCFFNQFLNWCAKRCSKAKYWDRDTPGCCDKLRKRKLLQLTDVINLKMHIKCIRCNFTEFWPAGITPEICTKCHAAYSDRTAVLVDIHGMLIQKYPKPGIYPVSMLSYLHTYKCVTYIHIWHPSIHTYIHSYIHTYIHTYVHTFWERTHMHTSWTTYIYACERIWVR